MPTITTAPQTYNYRDDVIHLEWTGDKFATILTTTVATEVNLGLYFQVWQEQDGVNTFLTERVAPYSLSNKIAFADLSPSVKVAHSAPHKDTLLSNAIHTDIDHGAAAAVTVRYSDQYGSPAEPEEPLTVSDVYHVIAGATRYMQGPNQSDTTMLHSYWNKDGKVVYKEVRKSDPDLLYLYARSTGTVTLRATIYYHDGSDDVVDTSISLTANKVNYVSCGWDQLGLSSTAPDASLVRIYTLHIVEAAGRRDKRYYALDDRAPDNDMHLAYTNGCGGVEMVRLSGYQVMDSEVEKVVYNRPRTVNTSFQDGLIGTIARSGKDVHKLSTGYYSKDMIIHLRQLLMADAWVVRKSRGQYYKIAITTKSAPIYNTMEQKWRLDITIEEDAVRSFTTFRN